MGIEPSAILTFRDEYPKLVDPELRAAAQNLAQDCYTIEEFLAMEWKEVRFTLSNLPRLLKRFSLHGHWPSKSAGNVNSSEKYSFITGELEVDIIPRVAVVWPDLWV